MWVFLLIKLGKEYNRNKDMPSVSVLMSVYKEPVKWMCDSINSILGQSFTDFEFIIINDNPEKNDNYHILQDFQKSDPRIILIQNDVNIGLTKSLNKALDLAKGKYIARMDADDISFPERLQRQYEYMENHPEVDICGSNFKQFGDVSLWSDKYCIMPEKHEEIVACMLFKNPIAHPAAFFKRIIKGERFFYDETRKKAQDYQLWYDLKNRGAILYNIQEYLLCYRKSTSQISSTGRESQNHVSDSIHADILSVMGVDSKTILMHNEICNFIISNISVDEKLNWLDRLYSDFESLNSKFLEEYILFLSCQVCLKYKKPFKLLAIKHNKRNLLGKMYFYRGLIASLVK